MREKGYDSIENEGKFDGLPTIHELRLIVALSSNLNKDELINISNNLDFKIKKYKLIK